MSLIPKKISFTLNDVYDVIKHNSTRLKECINRTHEHNIQISDYERMTLTKLYNIFPDEIFLTRELLHLSLVIFNLYYFTIDKYNDEIEDKYKNDVSLKPYYINNVNDMYRLFFNIIHTKKNIFTGKVDLKLSSFQTRFTYLYSCEDDYGFSSQRIYNNYLIKMGIDKVAYLSMDNDVRSIVPFFFDVKKTCIVAPINYFKFTNNVQHTDTYKFLQHIYENKKFIDFNHSFQFRYLDQSIIHIKC